MKRKAAETCEELKSNFVKKKKSTKKTEKKKNLKRSTKPANAATKRIKKPRQLQNGLTRSYEKKWIKDYPDTTVFIGVDEVARGALAGPLVVVACTLPLDVCIPGVNDSKKLSVNTKKRVYDELLKTPGFEYTYTLILPDLINYLNVHTATMYAMKVCIQKLFAKLRSKQVEISSETTVAFVDGAFRPTVEELPETVVNVVKGDQKVFVVAAASIVAKVIQMQYMEMLAKIYPEYSFQQHFGYGTKLHYEMITKHGVSDVHRLDFHWSSLNKKLGSCPKLDIRKDRVVKDPEALSVEDYKKSFEK